MNQIPTQTQMKGKKAQIDVQHAYFLNGFDKILAKAQHWVCKINQLPREYHEKIDKMKKSLNKLKNEKYKGYAKSGIFNNGTPIVTE